MKKRGRGGRQKGARRPRAAGGQWISFWCPALVCALYTGSRVLWCAVCLVGLVLLVDAALLALCVWRLRCSQTLSAQTVLAREEAQVVVSARLPRGLRPQMALYSAAVAGEQGKALCTLLSGGEQVEIPVRTTWMGRFPVGADFMYLYSPMGMFFKKLSLAKGLRGFPQQLWVLPWWYSLDGAVSAPMGGITYPPREQTRNIDPDTVAGSRPYEYGDPLKTINWKKTAGAQKLFVKEFDGPQLSTQARVWLSGLPEDPALRQMAAEAALSAAHFFFQQRVSGVLLRVGVEDGRVFSSRDLEAMSRELAAHPATPVLGEEDTVHALEKLGKSAPSAAVIFGRPQRKLLHALCALPAGSLALWCTAPQEVDPAPFRPLLENGITLFACPSIGVLRCVK